MLLLDAWCISPTSTHLRIQHVRFFSTPNCPRCPCSPPLWCIQLAKRMLGTKWQQSLGKHSGGATDLSNKTIMTVADWKRRAGYM